jgi:hypothetical protein
MSDSAPKHFADIAAALGPLLDNYKPEKANQTLLTLNDLGEKLPQDSSLRRVINSQITHILSSDFPINPDTTNKTMVLIGQIKDSLNTNDPAHAKLEDQLARILTFKLEKINGRASDSPASTAPMDKPVAAPEPAPKPEPQPQVVESPQPAPASEPAKEETKPSEETATVNDELADATHKLQISLDQMSETTRKAFVEFAPIYEHGGTVKSYVEFLQSQPAKDGINPAKIELEKLQLLAEKIEAAPAEADQFQVLYDQVDAKHKDPKNGVFSIFQRDYGGNARRFVVERTAQYAKYVPAEESRQRMIEDLHKLMEQAQKNIAEGPAKPAGGSAGDSKNGSNGRSFFHG